MRTLIAALILIPALALGQTAKHCDPASARIDDTVRGPLFAELKAADSEIATLPITNRLWREFTRAPDPHAQSLLDRAMRTIRSGLPADAVPLLDRLTAYCPDYAEGWNQRAFARFLTGDFEAAITDIDRALAIEPRHFGALAGKVLTLIRMGRRDLASDALEQGLKVHPWMPERRLLQTGEKI